MKKIFMRAIPAIITLCLIIAMMPAALGSQSGIVLFEDDFSSGVDPDVWTNTSAVGSGSPEAIEFNGEDVVHLARRQGLQTKESFTYGDGLVIQYDMYLLWAGVFGADYGGFDHCMTLMPPDNSNQQNSFLTVGSYGGRPNSELGVYKWGDWTQHAVPTGFEGLNPDCPDVYRKWISVALTLKDDKMQATFRDRDSGALIFSTDTMPLNETGARPLASDTQFQITFTETVPDAYFTNLKVISSPDATFPAAYEPSWKLGGSLPDISIGVPRGESSFNGIKPAPLSYFDTSAPKTSLFSAKADDVSVNWTNPSLAGEYSGLVSMPDTLDLAARAALALEGFASLSSIGGADLGEIVNAVILARNMSGSNDSLDVDAALISALLGYLADEDVLTDANSAPANSGQIALNNLYKLIPDDARNSANLVPLLEELSRCLLNRATVVDFYAFDYDGAALGADSSGVFGFGNNLMINGSALDAATQWANSGSSQKALLELIGEYYKNYLLLSKLWKPEAPPKAVFGADRGQFSGHMPSYTRGLIGLLSYAEATRDVRVAQFVRSSYEYIRDFGISAIGLYGELCTTANMTVLAVKLSQMGIGDFWGDAERYIRNEIAEKQITETSSLNGTIGVGLFLSDSSYPTHINPVNQQAEICCTTAAVSAMYCVWDAIVTGDSDMAHVNMLLNRSSSLLDVDSYLPYEGKAVITVKTAENVSVRMPDWVDMDSVAVSEAHIRNGRNIIVYGLSAGSVITITFDVNSWDETYSLKWKEGDFRKASTNPGSTWTPQSPSDRFTFTFRGYTVVGITPSVDRTNSNSGNYLLYQRGGMKNESVAPMKEAVRYTPEKTLLSCDGLVIEVPYVVSAAPSAIVTKTNGNTNELTVTVTELYSDGSEKVITVVFTINNNSEGTYDVGGYLVYVDTKGNTQIRECYIVSWP